jgi:hypothetical protein
MASLEASHASGGMMQAQRESIQAQSVVRWAAKEQRVDTPIGSGSSSDEEEEGEITLPPLPCLRITPPPLSGVISRHVGAMVSEHRLK